MKINYKKIAKTIFYGILVKSLIFTPLKTNRYEQNFDFNKKCLSPQEEILNANNDFLEEKEKPFKYLVERKIILKENKQSLERTSIEPEKNILAQEEKNIREYENNLEKIKDSLNYSRFLF